MRKYKLEIELSFALSEDADKVMEMCKDLVQDTSAERESKLVVEFDKQVQESVDGIKQIVNDALAQRVGITNLLQESNNTVVHMRQYKEESHKAVVELEDKIAQLVNMVKDRRNNIVTLLQETEKNIETTLNKLNQLDETIKNARQCAEASLFLRDMVRAQNNIVTGGKITMQEQRQYGFEVVKHWEL